MKKRLSALFTAVILLLSSSVVPFPVIAGGTPAVSRGIVFGTCGANLTWELDTETGALTIEGSGRMDDSPWWDDYHQLIKIVSF
ncbi:MAG: hypothetical protein J5854_07515 [Clostridia bacterium]|nr:hypothetical protein [Clostridia bacterium]